MISLMSCAKWRHAAEPRNCRDFAFAIAGARGHIERASRTVPNTRDLRNIPTPSLFLRPDLMVGPQLFSLGGQGARRRAVTGTGDCLPMGLQLAFSPLAFHGAAINLCPIITAIGGSFPCAKPRSFFSLPVSLSQAACKPTASAPLPVRPAARSSRMRPTTTSSPVRPSARSQARIATTRASAPAPTKHIRAAFVASDRYSTAIGAARPGGGFSFVSHHEHDTRGGGMPLPHRKGRA